MKKNVKILGAAAAALLAVAPVVASATVVNASDTTVSAPSNSTNTATSRALNINAAISATAGVTTPEAAAKSVTLTIDNQGTISGFNSGNASIINADGSAATTDHGKLVAGVAYRVMIRNVSFVNLPTSVNWNLGGAKWNSNDTATSESLAQTGVFYSAPFYLRDSSSQTQPYFTTNVDSNQIKNGETARVTENGTGLQVPSPATADSILAAAKGAVVAHNVNGDANAITTKASDITSQLASKGIRPNGAGVYTSLPSEGFSVTLTATNQVSGKTATVVVPFEGNYAGYPTISFHVNAATDPMGYSSAFNSVESKGTQNVSADQLVRHVDVNSKFTNRDALAKFQALTADGSASIDMSVLSNPVNTSVPGRYTVTLAATDTATGRTSRLSYIVQVGNSYATYQRVNYPAQYGINKWSIAGNTVSFIGGATPRVAGQSLVQTHETRVVNGVSYTRITDPDNANNNNCWVFTEYLGNRSHNNNSNSNTNRPSNSGETALRGIATVTYNGRGSVRLLDSEGHYVNQYVSKRSAWKVFAEKTVKGQHLYRIGNQNQWIPARFVNFR